MPERPENAGVMRGVLSKGMEMALDIFLFFNGNARDAVDFYARVFKAEKPYVMTYGEMPAGPEGSGCIGGPLPESARGLLAYANLKLAGGDLMCSDVPPGMPYTAGNNFAVSYSSRDTAELRRLFAALGEGGKTLMDLQKTFYSELFGMLTDKFGVIWQFIHVAEES